MPSIPRQKKCAHLGCNNPRARYSTLCSTHGGKDTKGFKPRENRADTNSMYHSPFWATFRRAWLSLHPLCAACECTRVATPATEVDHVFPWTVVGQEAFKRNVFQSLCARCHKSKTAYETRGRYIYYCLPIPIIYGIEDYKDITPSTLPFHCG